MDFRPNFIHAYGVELRVDPDDGCTHGEAPLRPDMLVPGTDRIRVGHLASLVDIVGGSPPGGPLTPTLDLRVRMLSRPPASGKLHLINRPAKWSRRLFVAEVPIYAAGAELPFAHSTITFLNERVPETPPTGQEAARPDPATLPGFHEMLPVRFPERDRAEIDWEPQIGNGAHGTILGSVQAILAEMAAEHLLEPSGPHVVTDLDVYFLNRVKAGPLAARAALQSRGDAGAMVRVALTDAGAEDRNVALVSALCERLERR